MPALPHQPNEDQTASPRPWTLMRCGRGWDILSHGSDGSLTVIGSFIPSGRVSPVEDDANAEHLRSLIESRA